MDLFIIFRLSAQNHCFSLLQKHLLDTGTDNVSSMMPKLALKMSSAACTENLARARDPRCIMEYGTASVQIYMTRPQLCPNAVRPGQRITQLGSKTVGQCWSNIPQDSASVLPISHLKCQKAHFSALFSCELVPVCWMIFFCPALRGKLSVALPSDVFAVHTSTSFATLENAPSDALPKTSCLSPHKASNKLKNVFFPCLPFFPSPASASPSLRSCTLVSSAPEAYRPAR